MIETHKRSIAKAITWRIIAVIITTLVAFLITGKPNIAIKIGALDTLIKLFSYYVHERTWNKMQFGRKLDPEYQI